MCSPSLFPSHQRWLLSNVREQLSSAPTSMNDVLIMHVGQPVQDLANKSPDSVVVGKGLVGEDLLEGDITKLHLARARSHVSKGRGHETGQSAPFRQLHPTAKPSPSSLPPLSPLFLVRSPGCRGVQTRKHPSRTPPAQTQPVPLDCLAPSRGAGPKDRADERIGSKKIGLMRG